MTDKLKREKVPDECKSEDEDDEIECELNDDDQFITPATLITTEQGEKRYVLCGVSHIHILDAENLMVV